MKIGVLFPVIFGSLLLAACGTPRMPRLTDEQTCHVGAYRLADGRVIDIAPTEGSDLRWRLEDGQTGKLAAARDWASTRGWTDRPDGKTIRFGGCDEGLVTFAVGDGEPVEGHKVRLVSRDVSFNSGGLQLAGRLVLPEGDAAVPIVVEVHGSEKDAATIFNWKQRMLPAQGVGVFVYDKRGTGASQGEYTQDFHLLAADAAEAVKAARAAAGIRAGRVGLEGGSQGGWVAPLAATRTPVDFVIVGFGLADSPLSENRDEALQDLEAAGYSDAATRAKALEVIAATEAVVVSHFERGYEELDRVRKKYGKEKWFSSVKGEFTGELLKYPNFALRIVGPMRDPGTTWNYDSVATLQRLDTPLLWVLAEDDTSAPPAITRGRLLKLAAEGRPVTVVQFPDTDHGILEYETSEDGERRETRYAEGYFRSTADFARDGRLSPPYGAGVLLTGAAAGSGPVAAPAAAQPNAARPAPSRPEPNPASSPQPQPSAPSTAHQSEPEPEPAADKPTAAADASPAPGE
jgi:pimeloyl-ACP methyl ester carboxylesterase